jgi:hypothetical protein
MFGGPLQVNASELMQALSDAGAPLEAIIIAVRALDEKDAEIRARDDAAKEKRAADAARKREERAAGKASKDGPRTRRGRGEDAPLNDNILIPPAEVKTSAKRASFDLPDWVPEEEWADFDEMRRAMPKVPWRPAAKRGVIAELEKLRGEGHCPAKLLRKAVTRGWRQVFPGDDTMGGRPNGRPAAPLTAEEAEKLAAYHASRGEIDKAERVRREATGPPRALGQLTGNIVTRVDHGQA